MYNTAKDANGAGVTVTYTVTFTFQGSAPPDLNRLVLVVDGLGSGTSATVVSPVPITYLGDSPHTGANPAGSPTVLGAGNVIASGWALGDATDEHNTKWALFKVAQLTPSAPRTPPSLSVKFTHVFGDGIGVTLGYAQGLLKVCKVAGPGVTVGTPFTFTAGSAPFTVPAGPAPGGTCVVAPVQFAVGSPSTVTVAESVPAGLSVSSITVAPPGQLVRTPNLSAGSVDVTVGSGVTEVTFTDKQPTGFLEICKKGPVIGNFEFWVNGGLGPFVIPVGGCSPAIEVVSGSAVIYERRFFFPGFLPGLPIICSTIPAVQQGPCIDLPGLSISIVTVAPGDTSTMTTAFITNLQH